VSEELDKHIKMFPSDFDNTSIARQLREANVPVQLYADIRDRLWLQLNDERDRRIELSIAISNLQYTLSTAINELKIDLSGK